MQQNDTTEQQIELLTIQLIAAMGFLLTVVISIILTYDKILSLSGEPRLSSDEEARKLSYFNSILIIIAGLTILLNPFTGVLVVIQFGGAILIVMGISAIINHFRYKNSNIF